MRLSFPVVSFAGIKLKDIKPEARFKVVNGAINKNIRFKVITEPVPDRDEPLCIRIRKSIYELSGIPRDEDYKNVRIVRGVKLDRPSEELICYFKVDPNGETDRFEAIV